MRLPFTARVVLLASTACAGLSMPAIAQTTTETTAYSNYIGRITVLADRIGRALTDVEGNISVVTNDEIEQRNVQSLEDLVRNIPGITASRQVLSGDPFGGSQIGLRIRGVEGNRIQMQVDGGRIPERITDGSRDYLDFNFTTQADVVRGPASVLWGADALGGVLALRTIGPDDLIAAGETHGGQVTVGYSEVTRSTNVAAAFAQRFSHNVSAMIARSRTVDHEMRLSNADPNGGPWACGRAVAYGNTSCGAFNPLDRTTDRMLVKLDWDITADQRLSFSYDRLDRLAQIENRATLGPSGTSYNIANPRTRDINRTRYAIDHEANIGGFIDTLNSTLSFSPSGYDQVAEAVARAANGDITRTFDYVDYSEDFLELDIQATSRFNLGATSHVLTYGFDGDYTETSYDRRRTVVNVTQGTSVDSVPNGFNFTDGTTTRADIYVQDQITLFGGKLEVTPGLRFATYRMSPSLNSSVLPHADNPTTDRRADELLTSLGATWRFNDTYSVWAHYGEGFKMPTFQQLYTSSASGTYDLVPAPWLVPEEVQSIEVGVRGEYGNSYWSVNAFKAEYENFIESFWFIPNTNDISYRNIAAVKTWGIEAEGAWEVSDALTLTGSLAWMDGEQRATPTSATTGHLVPPLSAVIGASYTFADYGLTLRADATFASKTTPAVETNFTPPSYQLLDLGASWEFAPNVVLNMQVNNVFDEKYYVMSAASAALVPTTAVANGSPIELNTGAGRNLALSISYTF
ncbi:TonB-dependent receptor domain-containing protein [Ketogulonicigenium vulgare]|uniref:TonB-dependent receptor plug n=1 Tax=Ketogulonicigenium vulgare (strain WSH-001) TaxID=759362 RepID=F9Y525_KETVW|nr:TonB-dependent receptor [Ketogulonicigenium vulgare]AEM40657.1 TonB-dependent receptor plug [Ketogulonicigenium vulgare WSH-001]ALJ80830.1 TonB-dependent receptor [Ketogulonicigenium vulgare]ANW33609.1 TonB-dependent receptor [Ketogulonicigenium vulgare]AOZ54371.1 TonB-dependent receptor plug [Ketogulonicigenium vulgare]